VSALAAFALTQLRRNELRYDAGKYMCGLAVKWHRFRRMIALRVASATQSCEVAAVVVMRQ
jgi:hypothetical protein